MSTTREEWRGGNGRQGRAAIGELKQGFEVRFSRICKLNDFHVHDLLACETGARDKPGNGGMEPEQLEFLKAKRVVFGTHTSSFSTN